jgi:hypothetical protein
MMHIKIIGEPLLDNIFGFFKLLYMEVFLIPQNFFQHLQ